MTLYINYMHASITPRYHLLGEHDAILSSMKLIIHWLIATLAIVVTAYLVPGTAVTLMGAVIAAVVLGALNLFIRPVIYLLTLPLNILTLGLFSIVINACLVLVAAYLVPGFMIAGFWHAVLFAIVLAIINWVFSIWSRA